MRVDCILFRLVDEVQQVVCAVVAQHQVYRLALGQHDRLELQALRPCHLQVALDAELLFPAVRLPAQNDGHGVCPAGFELVQVAHRELLVHGRDYSRDAGQVCGKRVEHAFHDNRVLVIGLDVEWNVARAGGVRNVGVVRAVVVHGTPVYGVDQPLGVACGDGDARLVVNLEVVEEERYLVALDARKHAVAVERFRVAAVITETVELGLSDAPAAAFQEFCRRRALACGPVAVAHEVLEYARLLAANFLNPRMLVKVGLLLVFAGAQEFRGLGACGLLVHTVEAAPHHEFDEIALAAALQAAVTPVTQRIVEEQRSLLGGVERTTRN